jgi:hypothetical protein
MTPTPTLEPLVLLLLLLPLPSPPPPSPPPTMMKTTKMTKRRKLRPQLRLLLQHVTETRQERSYSD